MTNLKLNESAVATYGLRQKRKSLLAAWDIAKGNILMGADVVTEERRAALVEWYHAILDLDADAITNVPQEIGKYLV